MGKSYYQTLPPVLSQQPSGLFSLLSSFSFFYHFRSQSLSALGFIFPSPPILVPLFLIGISDISPCSALYCTAPPRFLTRLAHTHIHPPTLPPSRTIHHLEKLANYATPPVSPQAYRGFDPPSVVKGTVMDSNGRRPRQSSSYAAQQGLLPTQQQTSSYGMPFGKVSGQKKPPSSAATSRSQGSPQSYAYTYGNASQYGGSGIQQAATGVTAAPGYPDLQADQQRASQPYPAAYGQNVLYNVPSQQATSPTTQYNPVQQEYSPRQSAAIGVLSNQFAVPQQQSYYGGPTSAPAATLGTQGMTVTSHPAFGFTTQQGSIPSLSSAYTAAGMTDPNSTTASAGYAQTQTGYDMRTTVEKELGRRSEYEDQLKQVFGYIRESRLAEAGQSIHHLTDVLLNSLEDLGKFAPKSAGPSS